jgi:hypothetical protein
VINTTAHGARSLLHGFDKLRITVNAPRSLVPEYTTLSYSSEDPSNPGGGSPRLQAREDDSPIEILEGPVPFNHRYDVGYRITR